MTKQYSKSKVIIVPDGTRVVTESELLRLYEIGGSTRAVADALGCPLSTVARGLQHGQASSSVNLAARTQAVKDALNGGSA